MFNAGAVYISECQYVTPDDASYVVGAAIPVDGGLTAHTGQPNVARLLAKQA